MQHKTELVPNMGWDGVRCGVRNGQQLDEKSSQNSNIFNVLFLTVCARVCEPNSDVCII